MKTEAGTEDATWQSRLQCSEHAAACRPCAPSALPGPVSPHSPDGDKALWRVPLGPWHLYPQGRDGAGSRGQSWVPWGCSSEDVGSSVTPGEDGLEPGGIPEDMLCVGGSGQVGGHARPTLGSVLFLKQSRLRGPALSMAW